MGTIIRKAFQLVTSRTVWTLICLLIINIVPEIKYLFSPDQQIYLNVVLTFAATVFKVFPSQEYK